ncbi:MAG: hypothetical protein NC115_08430 [Bacteroidales bacterium]|nr:hypothetical protein [Bacteroidales bacterium]
MKNRILLLAAAVCLAFSACRPVSNQMDPGMPSDGDIVYTLRQVLEYDPVNVNGIDVCPYFDFFSTLRFTIQVRDGKMSYLQYTDGDIPFSPFSFGTGDGFVECRLDMDVLPYALKLVETGETVAYFRNGEFYIPFQLDCKDLSYEYRFREIGK